MLLKYNLSVDESHTHALSRDTKHLRLECQVCFYRHLFLNAAKPQRCISWPVLPLRSINKITLGAKLILTADLASPMIISCASLGYLLMAKHCRHHLFLNVCFSPPIYGYSPTPNRLTPRYHSRLKKLPQKPESFKYVACRISYEIIMLYIAWVGVICLICIHEHKGAAPECGHIRQITTAHATYVM